MLKLHRRKSARRHFIDFIRATRPRNAELSFEALEPRVLLSAIVVNSPLDISSEVDGLTTLREAVTAANASPGHDEIVFAPLLTGVPIVLAGGAVVITDDLTISGLGAQVQSITTNYTSPIFVVETPAEGSSPDVAIAGLTLTGAAGAIVSNGNLTVDQVAIIGNLLPAQMGDGAGIQQIGGSLTVTRSLISDNIAPRLGGGIYVNNALVVISDSVISRNTADAGAGIAFGDPGPEVSSAMGRSLITRTTIQGNTAAGATRGLGGGIFLDSNTALELTDSVVENNTAHRAGSPAASRGGGIFSNARDLVVENTTVSGNTSQGSGGGVCLQGSNGAQGPASTINNSMITGNTAQEYGGGIGAMSWFVLNDSTVSSNTAGTDGGGLFLGNLDFPQFSLRARFGSVSGSLFLNNSAQASGGGIAIFDGSIEAFNTTVQGNSAVNGGGVFTGIHNFAYPIEFTASTIQNNSATNGGGLYSDKVSVTLVDTSVTHNTASTDGGGAYLINGGIQGTGALLSANEAGRWGGGLFSSLALVSGVVASENAAESGAGAYLQGGELRFVSLLNNTASGSGGGLHVSSSGRMWDSQVSHNTSGVNGGGVAITSINSGYFRTYDSVFSHNTSAQDGGGIWMSNSALLLFQCEVHANQAMGSGGGVYASNTTFHEVTFEETGIYDNVAAGHGGGIALFTVGQGKSLRSAIHGNSSGADGGGLYLSSTVDFDLVTSTVSGNTAQGLGGGMAVIESNSQTEYSTIAYNAASSSPGVAFVTAVPNRAINFSNSILSGSHDLQGNPASDLTVTDPGVVRASNIIVGDVAPGTVFALNWAVQLGVGPLLADLADNGGHTLSHMLLEGSPALDAGYTALADMRWDQRGAGYVRTYGSTTDIGAFERGPVFNSIMTYNAPPSGADVRVRVTQGEAIEIISANGGIPLAVQPLERIEHILINGSDSASDRVVIDYDYSDPISPHGLTFIGNSLSASEPSGVDDRLELAGIQSIPKTHAYIFSGPQTGRLVSGTGVINHQGVETIYHRNTPEHVAITLPGGDDVLTVQNITNSSGNDQGIGVFLFATASSTQTVVLDTPLPTKTLTVNGEAGDDQIVLSLRGYADTAWSNLAITADGDAGNDTFDTTLTHASRRLTLRGGDGDDTFLNPRGLTSLDGGNGTDRIVASGSSLVLSDAALTGTGQPIAFTGLELAALSGTQGDDVLDASTFSGSVTLSGGAGSDRLTGSAQTDVLEGGDGADTLTGAAGDDTLVGGDGVDLLLESGGSYTFVAPSLLPLTGEQVTDIEEADITGSEGDDVIDTSAFNGAATIRGAGGNDRLTGGPLSDLIEGGAGDDMLDGGLGEDTLDGGDGVDLIAASGSLLVLTNSALSGSSQGNKILISIDRAGLTGTALNDWLDASAFTGRVTLDGGDGDDTLLGGSGNDLLLGGAGRDWLSGGAGNDTLDGGNGNDTLLGGSGNDLLNGGNGNDSLDGGADADTLVTSTGKDTVTGVTLGDVVI